jgi:hypothetical protein
MTIDIPVKAIPNVIADIKAFLNFIPATKPRIKMISGTKIAEPKPKI